MNLRKAARGRQCQVRLAGVCNHDESTVVLAHYRLAGLSGMGMKSPDAIGAWACSACHSYVDTRPMQKRNWRWHEWRMKRGPDDQFLSPPVQEQVGFCGLAYSVRLP